MDIISKLKSLEKNPEFKDWQKQHKNHYLVHAFKLLDEPNKSIWQIGYYDKESDTITTFVMEDNKVLDKVELRKRYIEDQRKMIHTDKFFDEVIARGRENQGREIARLIDIIRIKEGREMKSLFY